jgi:hypothetical protein
VVVNGLVLLLSFLVYRVVLSNLSFLFGVGKCLKHIIYYPQLANSREALTYGIMAEQIIPYGSTEA